MERARISVNWVYIGLAGGLLTVAARDDSLLFTEYLFLLFGMTVSLAGRPSAAGDAAPVTPRRMTSSLQEPLVRTSIIGLALLSLVAVIGQSLVRTGSGAPAVSVENRSAAYVISTLQQPAYSSNSANFALLSRLLYSEGHFNQSQQYAAQAIALNPSNSAARRTSFASLMAAMTTGPSTPSPSALSAAYTALAPSFFPAASPSDWAALGAANVILTKGSASPSAGERLYYARAALYDFQMVDAYNPSEQTSEIISSIQRWIQQQGA